MTPEELEARFVARNLRAGAILILSPEDARSLVDAAALERIPILGLDGFHLHHPDGVEPDLGESVDFSSAPNLVAGAWTEAREFIQTHSRNVDGFEVVLGGAPDRLSREV